MILRIVWAIALPAALLSGCLTPNSVEPTRYYTVDAAPQSPGEAATELSLGMRALVAARPYKLEIAYRAEANRLAYFPRSEWAELPGTLVSRSLMDAIAASKIFSDAGDAATMARPDFIFTGELRRFEADYTGDTPKFVVTISGSIRATGEGKNLWMDEVEARVPLENASPYGASDASLADIARAASEAVALVSSELCSRIREALDSSTTP